MKRLALLLALLCIGCSKVSEQTASSSGSNPWTIPGVLRIAGRQEPDTLMPIIGTQVVDTDLSMFWCGHLLNWSDRNEFVPELATEAPTLSNGGISKDGLTITYHLRRGVTWQDFEVVNEPGGRPILRFAGVARQVAEALGASRNSVSITHTADMAMAVVILES